MSLAMLRQSTEFLNYKEFGSETELTESEIPKAPQNRKATDVWCLYSFAIFLVITLVLVGYTLSQSDISKLDKLAIHVDFTDTDSDLSRRQDLQFKWKPIEIPEVTENSNNDENFDRYMDEVYGRNKRDVSSADDNKDFANYFSKVGWRLATTCLISLGLCIGIVPMYRYATATVVWGILILSWSILLIINIKLWFVSVESNSQAGLVFSIVLSGIVLLFFILFFALAKRIKLVIMMFKETTKATFDMPKLFFVSAVALFFAWIIVVLWLVTTIYMSTAGTSTDSNESEHRFNNWMYFGFFFNVVIALWILEILHGIMHLIISGAIAKWYFTGDKTRLGNPILTSIIVAFKFHLGTVTLGAFIITLVTIIRIIVRSLSKGRCRYFIECLMARIEVFLKIFTDSAYIITAMHGTPFFKSGKDAVKLYGMNICNVVSVFTIGNFVIAMSHIFVVGVCLIITYLLVVMAILSFCCTIKSLDIILSVQLVNNCDNITKDVEESKYEIYSFLLVILIAGLCCYTILGTIKIAANTILVCLCEDCVINDGTTTPYAMPRSLMEFVDASKKVFAKVITEKGLPTI